MGELNYYSWQKSLLIPEDLYVWIINRLAVKHPENDGRNAEVLHKELAMVFARREAAISLAEDPERFGKHRKDRFSEATIASEMLISVANQLRVTLGLEPLGPPNNG